MKKHTVYKWILDILAERRTTQSALADYINLDPPKLSRALTGERKLQPSEAVKISNFLDMPLEWVLTGRSFDDSDADLMLEAAKAVSQAAKIKGIKPPLSLAMEITVELYNYILLCRKRGDNGINPSSSIAALFLENKKA